MVGVLVLLASSCSSTEPTRPPSRSRPTRRQCWAPARCCCRCPAARDWCCSPVRPRVHRPTTGSGCGSGTAPPGTSTTGSGPVTRNYFSAAYDEGRDVVVLYGGDTDVRRRDHGLGVGRGGLDPVAAGRAGPPAGCAHDLRRHRACRRAVRRGRATARSRATPGPGTARVGRGSLRAVRSRRAGRRRSPEPTAASSWWGPPGGRRGPALGGRRHVGLGWSLARGAGRGWAGPARERRGGRAPPPGDAAGRRVGPRPAHRRRVAMDRRALGARRARASFPSGRRSGSGTTRSGTSWS